jgi:uncharacterized protein YbjT (DUF2867 family)
MYNDIPSDVIHYHSFTLLTMWKPVVLVLGSSGLVGKATVKSLSESYADKVTIKAATRDPSRIKDLAELNGVDVVAIDMAGADTKDKVKATGAAAVYIVTPGVPNRDEMVKKAATASRDAGVMNLLVVSSPLVGTEMEDTEHLGRPFSVIESHVKSLGVQYTILRLPFFIDNNWQHVDSIKSNSTGTGSISFVNKHGACALGLHVFRLLIIEQP